MVQKRYALSRRRVWNLEFASFPGLAVCDLILSCSAGHRQLPVSQAITSKQPIYTDSHSVFHFQDGI